MTLKNGSAAFFVSSGQIDRIIDARKRRLNGRGKSEIHHEKLLHREVQ